MQPSIPDFRDRSRVEVSRFGDAGLGEWTSLKDIGFWLLVSQVGSRGMSPD